MTTTPTAAAASRRKRLWLNDFLIPLSMLTVAFCGQASPALLRFRAGGPCDRSLVCSRPAPGFRENHRRPSISLYSYMTTKTAKRLPRNREPGRLTPFLATRSPANSCAARRVVECKRRRAEINQWGSWAAGQRQAAVAGRGYQILPTVPQPYPRQIEGC